MFCSGVTGRAAIHKKSTELSSECCGAQRPPDAAAADPDPPRAQLFSMGHICPAACLPFPQYQPYSPVIYHISM